MEKYEKNSGDIEEKNKKQNKEIRWRFLKN